MDDLHEQKSALGRLEVKVEGLGREIADLRSMLLGRNTPAVVEMDNRINALDKLTGQRLDNIEKHVASIIEKLDRQARTPWPQWIAFAALLWSVAEGVGGFFLTGVNARSDRMEQDLASIQSQMVPRGEYTERWREQAEKNAEVTRRIEAMEKRK